MGRNKELRRKIAAQEKVIEDHEAKIRKERMKSNSDEGVIRTWQREMASARKKMDLLSRRLKRDW